MITYELNLDGLVGPTHHYAGLAFGNVASTNNALKTSNPQAAANQGLAKMRLLHQLGLKQGIMPPHQRPNLYLLHQLGFKGTPIEQLQKAYKAAPELLSACYSASSMWTANAATVSPSSDTKNHKLHFTAANLVSNLHRHQEADFSSQLLQSIFSDPIYFEHHPILPKSLVTGDEGAANHNRICLTHAHQGVHLFVYGKAAKDPWHLRPQKYPARQSKEASQAIARNHLLDLKNVIFARQNPRAIDLGVFHNDVIAVANESVFLTHEEAFLDQAHVLDQLREKANFPLSILQITNKQLTIEEAVESYLFNSQLLSLPQGMLLVAPIECEQNQNVRACIQTILEDNKNPINDVVYLNLKQSMQNGGGPACLRLRIPMNKKELTAMHQGVLAHDALLDTLQAWVLKYYRTHLALEDLADPQLMNESLSALDELTQILKLGSIYPFQV